MYTLSVENESGERLELSHSLNYTVVNVEGLAPPAASVNLTHLGGLHGSRLNSATIPQRNIVIYVYIENPIEKNRQNLYLYFKSSREVKVFFKNKNRDVYIEGIVESIECPLFEQRQQMQISILCPQPYFRAASQFIAEISKITGLFEFPFCIEDPMEFSYYDAYKVTEIYNAGDVESGMLIELTALGSIVNPCIWNSSTREFFSVYDILYTGDVLQINTVSGERYVRKKLSGATEWTNSIATKTMDSTWLQIYPGHNSFTYTHEGAEANEAEVTFTGYTLFGCV